MATCDPQAADNKMATQHLYITLVVLAVFVVSKSYYNHVRRCRARCAVVVIGAGPTGMTAALIASQAAHVSRVIVYEELSRSELIERTHQVELNRRSRDFLSGLGVDFDSVEGCLESNIFHTRLGVLLEHLLDKLALASVSVTLKFGVKFCRDRVAEIEAYPGRKVVVASDGSSGQSARLLGLSDEFIQSSCHAFGAVASVERPELSCVPLAERRIHGLMFDLTAYGIDFSGMDVSSGFSLKMFGSTRHRFMTLALPRSDSAMVRHMRLILDRSLMRNIFIKCFNICKFSSEAELSESWALRHLKFSPRLFDIKLFHRLQTVAYFQEPDMLVMVAGEAARCCNCHTGLDVNMAIASLPPLGGTLSAAACALTDWDVMTTMLQVSEHSQHLCKQFLKAGFKQDMFSRYY